MEHPAGQRKHFRNNIGIFSLDRKFIWEYGYLERCLQADQREGGDNGDTDLIMSRSKS